jgi:hypothetical protein
MKHIAPVVVLLMISSASVRAQDPAPPIPGVTGTIGLDGTVDKFYAGTHQAIVKTADGVRHLLHLSSRTVVHGADNPLRGLEVGNHVVVQYVEDGDAKTAVEIDRIGDGGLKAVEGIVTNIDRPDKTLTVRLAVDDALVRLRLTDQAARHVGKNIEPQTRVILYYAEDGGTWVAHYFRRADVERFN